MGGGGESCIVMLFCICDVYLLQTPHRYFHFGINIGGEFVNSEFAIEDSYKENKLLFQEFH